MSEFVEVGFFKRTHGFKGVLILTLHEGFTLKIHELDTLMCGKELKSAIPFFIEEISGSENKMFVKLEDINTMDEALHLTGTPVFCDQSFIISASNKNYVGFKVLDLIHGSLGEVSSIQRMPAQDILVVNHPDGYEILLPDVPDFVKSVDSKKKRNSISCT